MCLMSGDDKSNAAGVNNTQALQNNATANALSSASNTNANNVYSTLAPTLTHEATNPSGFSPTDLNAMHTAATDSLGGSTAGITGQANLQAARTRNAGAFQPALSEAGRDASRKDAEAAVNIQAQNAQQKEKNRQAGITGLQSLYGNLDKSTLDALGIGNQALGVGNGAIAQIPRQTISWNGNTGLSFGTG